MTTGHHDILITAQASVTLCVCFKLTIRLLAYIDSSMSMLHSQILQDKSDEFLTVNPISEEEFSVGNSPWGIPMGNSPSGIPQRIPMENSPRWIHHGEFTVNLIPRAFFVNSPICLGQRIRFPKGNSPWKILLWWIHVNIPGEFPASFKWTVL